MFLQWSRPHFFSETPFVFPVCNLTSLKCLPFSFALGGLPQACSLSRSGFSIVWILLFMPGMWIIIWWLLFKFLAFLPLFLIWVWCIEKIRKKQLPEGSRGRVILDSIEGAMHVTEFFFLLFFFCVFRKILPFLSLISYMFPHSPTIYYFGGCLKREAFRPRSRSSQPCFPCIDLLLPAGKRGAKTSMDASIRAWVAPWPSGLSVLRPPVVATTTKLPCCYR